MLGIKMLTEPFTGRIMLRMSSVPHCFEKLGITVWPSAVLRRTGSGSRHTCPLEGGVTGQDFFQPKFVLPAVAEIILVQQCRAWSSDQIL